MNYYRPIIFAKKYTRCLSHNIKYTTSFGKQSNAAYHYKMHPESYTYQNLQTCNDENTIKNALSQAQCPFVNNANPL